MIGIIASLMPRARIDVVTQRVSVLRDRIYPELVQMVGDVGIYGGGKKTLNKRVMCYTVGSLHHATASDCDILIGDECQELAADKAAAELMRWQNSRNYGLSASHDMRYDGKDLRMHGVFGPIIFSVDYEQAKKAGMVVPITIKWSSVVMDYDPCGSHEDIEKKRNGFWTNEYRNRIIAEDARRYDDDTQVLITVETLQHAMHLKKLLPEYTLVYMDGGLSEQDRNNYARQGLCSHSEPLMDLERKLRLTRDYEKGKLKKVICTTVWNVGVSFNNLAVLIRADGGGSSINAIQIPGRVSRTATGKECAIVHDYLDQFNPGYKRRAVNRAKMYQQNRWEQEFPRPSMLQEFLG
jgi:superfamily II DNA or RNA helicase